MDDVYSISVAKTEYREGYNTGDVERVLAVFADAFIDMSEGQPSSFGTDAAAALRLRLQDLFRNYDVTLFAMIIDIVPMGDWAYDYGWHKFSLRPKGGGRELKFRLRYFERWEKAGENAWKITYIITSKEEMPSMEPFPESQVVASLAG
jgi:ketosteroid isomerase-like protein